MKILLLTGMPGVGKSTVSSILAEDERFNLIKSYTDRPQRDDDSDHVFLTEDEMTSLLLTKTCAAYTRIDGYRYCSLRNQFDNQKINVYTVDAHGINDTLRAFPNADFMSILITRENIHIDQMRKDRIVEIPSRDQVNFVIDNDTDTPDPVVSVVKFLTLYEDGILFENYHAKVLSMSEEIEELEKESQTSWDRAQALRRQLDVYTQKIDDS